jgi:hypothetical protein
MNPSTGPLAQLSVSPACTAARSVFRLAAKRLKAGASQEDRHVLEPTEDGSTRFYIEESLAGVLVALFFGSEKLEVQHQRWLAALKAVAEGGAAR